MRRRGRSVGAVAATLAVSMLATACHISPVKPDETVTISGRAVDGHGKPLAGATLHLYKEADFGEFIVGSVLAIGTLGGVCLLPGAPPLCHKAKSATTRSDGSFTFTLKGSDTTGLIGDESTMDLVVAAKGATATSASMTLSFRVTSATVALPTARLWDTAPRVAEGNGHIDLSWAALPSTYGSSAKYYGEILDPGSEFATWNQEASTGKVQLDARLIEDHSASVAATARAGLGSGVSANYLTPRVPVRPISGAPPSRHRPCLVVSGTTTLSQTPSIVCVLTDGDITRSAHLVAGDKKVATGAVIDLGTARRVSLVVARGVTGSVVIEASADGRTYRQIGTGGSATVAVRVPPAAAVRYVRLRSPSGLDESQLTEISVW